MPTKETENIYRHPLRVAIVEDDELIRENYRTLIDEADNMVCVANFGSCEDLLDEIENLLLDVILMDIGLPGISGIEGIKKVKMNYPSIDIIMLTVYDDNEKIFNSIYAGASGYVLKNSSPEELIQSIIEVKFGAPMSASIARRVLSFIREDNNKVKNNFHLTPREQEILQSLVEGLSFKKIADKLFISPLTVHSHIKRIYEKLHVHSKAEAVAKAIKNKLID